MMIQSKAVADMQRRIDACCSYVDALAHCNSSPEKINTLLDAAMKKIELCCIDMRRLCEEIRPRIPQIQFDRANYHTEKMYGAITRTDNGWMDIRLNALLPHCRMAGGTQYVSDSITRLMQEFTADGGKLPMYEKAFLAIVEYCGRDCSTVFDQDNKGYKGVINALKGNLFPDDNQFELSLGLFTVQDDNPCCHIYVMPAEDAGDFLYQMQTEGL